jgi:hypothetical protein
LDRLAEREFHAGDDIPRRICYISHDTLKREKGLAVAASWITALKVIPWGDVVESAPAVLRGAKKLWSRVGQAAPEPAPDRLVTLQQEVERLKEHADSMANLISSLASQNVRLVEAVDILRARTRMLLVLSGVLVVATAALAALLLR